MIVRISGEAQYEVPDEDGPELHELDAAVVRAVHEGADADFTSAFGALVARVREAGTPLAEDDLRGSDAILPPADITLAEVGPEFDAEGLIPD